MKYPPWKRRTFGKNLELICDRINLPYTNKKGSKPVKRGLFRRKPPKA